MTANQLRLAFVRPSRPEGLPVISLFSGAGGLDLGLESAGDGEMRICSWVEKDAECKLTLCENFPWAQKRFFGDITRVSPRHIMDATGLEREDTFLVAGGPPCQAFSTAGLRRSIHEQRGQVVDHYFDMIKVLRPRFFVFENVRGLLSVAIKHRPYDERIESERINPGEPNLDDEERLGSVFKMIVLPRFKRLGYEVLYGLVNAADYGTAQVRHRLIILGSRDREFGSGVFRKKTGRMMTSLDLLPPTHHRFAPYSPIRPWRTLHDAIGQLADKLPSIDDVFTYSEERKAVWCRIPPGQYWTYIRDNPELFPEGLEALMGGAYSSGGGKVGFWRRLSWDLPAPTLPTQPQHFATGLCHPDQERPLSVPEYAALQDFSDDYVFLGNKASKYKQIGNAIPVRLGTAIGSLLLAVAGYSNSNEIDENDSHLMDIAGSNGSSRRTG